MELAEICPLTTADALRRAATIAPDIEAVIASDGRLTYSELSREVARIRSALVRAGIVHGDHVGLCLGNSGRWIALFLALGSIGAVTVPVNTRFRGDEIAYVLKQARIKTLFLADQFLNIDFIAMLRGICPAIDRKLPDPAFPHLERIIIIGSTAPGGASIWGDFLQGAADDVPPNCQPDDLLLIQYTSGTTSFPKGVMLLHKNMLANGFFAGTRMGFRPGDRFHTARPFFHVAGTSQSILASLQHVVTLVTMDRFEAGEALRLMEAERCTHFSGNDTMALMLLNHPDRLERKIILRGAWVAASAVVVKRVIDELGAREAVTAYGLSECSPNVSLSCWWEPEEIRISGRMRPQPGVEIRIRDTESGADCLAGAVGEILVRGWCVMQGYYDKPEETAATIDAQGWLATGDLGRLSVDGRLEFVGRAKDIIRVGGENVAPSEIENMLLRHPKVRLAQIVGVPHHRLMEVVAAFIVLNDGCDCEPDELIAWCKDQMAGFKVPQYLRIVDGFEEIGMTASAKIQKKQLAAYAVQIFGLENGTSNA